jgi:hypothetical protein
MWNTLPLVVTAVPRAGGTLYGLHRRRVAASGRISGDQAQHGDIAYIGRSLLVFILSTAMAHLVEALLSGRWLRPRRRTRRLVGMAIMVCGASAIAALASEIASGDTPIPDSRFPTYVKFAADEGNNGFFSNQARTDAAPVAPQPPCFMAGFFRPEDFTSFGMLISFGNQAAESFGRIALSTQGKALLAFQWSGLSWYPLNVAPVIWPTGSIKLNQWSFIALVLKSTSSRDIIMDGVKGTDAGKDYPWPVAGEGHGLAITFGSYGDTTPEHGVGAHNFNGGLRDWAIVRGIPTAAELERMRNGDSPMTVWGAGRVWGYWHFTANPQLGQKEPDVTGGGHNLTYSDAGSQAGHTLPILVSPAAPARPTPRRNPG